MKVKVWNMNSRSSGLPVRNQFIIETDEGIFFQSYSTIIAAKIKGQIILDPRWDYSVTTGKYRNQFLCENTKETRRKVEAGIYEIRDLN